MSACSSQAVKSPTATVMRLPPGRVHCRESIPSPRKVNLKRPKNRLVLDDSFTSSLPLTSSCGRVAGDEGYLHTVEGEHRTRPGPAAAAGGSDPTACRAPAVPPCTSS